MSFNAHLFLACSSISLLYAIQLPAALCKAQCAPSIPLAFMHLRRRRSQGRQDARNARTPKLSVAHEGSVTAVLPTTDGRHLLTAGTDSRLRLWDTSDYRCVSNTIKALWQLRIWSCCTNLGISSYNNICRNLLVNYRNTFNRANKVCFGRTSGCLL